MSISKTDIPFLTAAHFFFSKDDRVRIRSGFYQDEEGYIIQIGKAIQVKLDHLVFPITIHWEYLENLSKCKSLR